MVLQNAPGSSYIFPATVQGSAISPRTVIPFIEEWCLERDLGIQCACCFWSVTDSRLNQMILMIKYFKNIAQPMWLSG